MSPDRLRTAIATVCLSGTLEQKLQGAAAAGFDGVELFEADLIANPLPPGEVRLRCADLGMTVDLYQPFRDFDSTDPGRAAANLRRAEKKFDVMTALGADTLLLCSSVAPDAVPDEQRLADQLGVLADRAAARGLRIAYEALAWGTHVNTYEQSWRVVELAGHPALGLCLDSFHVLSRGSDPTAIAGIPGEKVFFLQLADAPAMDMDVLHWSRHYRLFPGQGSFDLDTFLRCVLRTGYSGPLSLEVFNDVFRQADPGPAAVDAMRSLRMLTEPPRRQPRHVLDTEVPAPPELAGIAFVEIGVDRTGGRDLAQALEALGFARSGRHRTKPVDLWENGGARILLNRGAPRPPAITAVAVESTDPEASARRARAMAAPVLPRERGPAEADISAVAAPDGTSMFFCRTDVRAGPGDGWLADFAPAPGGAVGRGGAGPRCAVERIDHIGLTQPFDHFDEATLFYRSVLGLDPQTSGEVAAPFGLIRTRAMADPERRVRLALTVSLLRRGTWAPGVAEPQYVALLTSDIVEAVTAARARGARMLDIPENYYDDLQARVELPADTLDSLRALGILYESAPAGRAYLHAGTELLGGRVFLQLVQRIGDHDGYGWADAPVRMAAHRRFRDARAPAD
ncbi:sugar phosphate isomerase/epimerase and 4-hydroxyphenylpyruvate domain-containing protein [Actinomadura vinacea]|uniref:3-dehydroshikimate dehydratase n=1 Tax=Actinomadura vinacea TaxID=115336 RepID=A0ABN3JT95_9ACTN